MKLSLLSLLLLVAAALFASARAEDTLEELDEDTGPEELAPHKDVSVNYVFPEANGATPVLRIGEANRFVWSFANGGQTRLNVTWVWSRLSAASNPDYIIRNVTSYSLSELVEPADMISVPDNLRLDDQVDALDGHLTVTLMYHDEYFNYYQSTIANLTVSVVDPNPLVDVEQTAWTVGGAVAAIVLVYFCLTGMGLGKESKKAFQAVTSAAGAPTGKKSTGTDDWLVNTAAGKRNKNRSGRKK